MNFFILSCFFNFFYMIVNYVSFIHKEFTSINLIYLIITIFAKNVNIYILFTSMTLHSCLHPRPQSTYFVCKSVIIRSAVRLKGKPVDMNFIGKVLKLPQVTFVKSGQYSVHPFVHKFLTEFMEVGC